MVANGMRSKPPVPKSLPVRTQSVPGHMRLVEGKRSNKEHCRMFPPYHLQPRRRVRDSNGCKNRTGVHSDREIHCSDDFCHARRYSFKNDVGMWIRKMNAVKKECVKKAPVADWRSALSSQVVTETDLALEHVHAMARVAMMLPVKALVSIIGEYVIWKAGTLTWDGSSYCEMHRSDATAPHQPQMSLFLGGVRGLRRALEDDLVSEIEMTQQCSTSPPAYYRAYFTVRALCTFGSIKQTLIPRSAYYQVIPVGDTDDAWPLQMGGPTLETTLSPAIYRLSNGVQFDVSRNGAYQIKFVRRV